MAQQQLTGRNLRWYFNGQLVGLGRQTMLKPDVNQGLDTVKECGNPDVVEYALKVPETSINFGYNLINKGALAKAMGQTLSNGLTGEVPDIPTNFDIVERRIVPGTEGTQTELYSGYSIYQLVQVEKQAWDQEVDKLVSAAITGKCKKPRDFEGNNGILFNTFTGNGSTTAFILASKAIPLKDGTLIIRAEAPLGTVLRYGAAADYTAASTSSTTTITFNVAPASSSVPNINVIYGY